MLEFSGRGQSPLGVGPRIDRALSQTATRKAAPALPGIDATMDGSEFQAQLPMS
jgi:hypothetical protein